MEYLIKGGIDGIVVAGCTGADATLDEEEQIDFVRHINENWGSKTTVIAGDGANVTYEAVDFARRMEDEADVNLHLQVSPYKVKPSDAGIIQHYEHVAESIQGEVILYSVPGRTGGKGVLPAVAKQLMQHPRIIGIKEASGDISRIQRAIQLIGDDGFVISGDDGLTLSTIMAGGTGVISVAANVAPELVKKSVDSVLRGDYTEADESGRALAPLYSALFPKSDDGNPSPNPCALHYALNRMGINVGLPRLPLTDLEPAEKEGVDAALRSLKLIE